MCGRFANNKTIEQQAARFEADPRDTTWQASANCAPSQALPIVFHFKNQRYLRLARWGFEGSWAPGKPIINAQSETAATKATFKHSFRSQRCLVPAIAFYEWKSNASSKEPMIFHCTDRRLFAMAGLWEQYETESGKHGRFTVLTTAANPKLVEIHKRMPVILAQDDEEAWLSPSSELSTLQDLCKTYDADLCTIQSMNPAINKVANNALSLLDGII